MCGQREGTAVKLEGPPGFLKFTLAGRGPGLLAAKRLYVPPSPKSEPDLAPGHPPSPPPADGQPPPRSGASRQSARALRDAASWPLRRELPQLEWPPRPLRGERQHCAAGPRQTARLSGARNPRGSGLASRPPLASWLRPRPPPSVDQTREAEEGAGPHPGLIQTAILPSWLGPSCPACQLSFPAGELEVIIALRRVIAERCPCTMQEVPSKCRLLISQGLPP